MIKKFWIRRLPVWPFHAWALVALVLGGVFIFNWWPEHYPEESELVEISGQVARVRVRDDIFDTAAGGILQGWTSTYFTLEDIEGEFRYPRSHPNSILVRDGTSVEIDVWVERAAVGGIEPMVIWQIREHNPYKREHENVLGPETFVSHGEIVKRLAEIDRSMIEAGVWLWVFSAAFFFFGFGAKRWNRYCASKES
jgi:hypothetical protein